MIPFSLSFEPGTPIWEQVVYAAKKAFIAGQIRPGDRFPSVRTLSRALKINPNTAHKVIAQLVAEELIEVRPGLNTVVRKPTSATRAERGRLLRKELERLVVEAKKLGIGYEDLTGALEDQWHRLDGSGKNPKKRKSA